MAIKGSKVYLNYIHLNIMASKHNLTLAKVMIATVYLYTCQTTVASYTVHRRLQDFGDWFLIKGTARF